MKALITGAGIGGLTAAIALRRAGIEVEVYERASRLAEVGAGISLWANAIACLSALGLGDEILRSSVAYDGAGLRTPDGARVGSVSVEHLKRRFPVPIVVLHRAELMDVLHQAFGTANLHLGKALVAFRDDGGGVHAEFSDGTSARGDFLVGADGLRSQVRSTIHGDRPPRYAGCTAWRGVVSVTQLPVEATETWGRGNIFGQVPMSGGRSYWYATQNGPPGGKNADERAALLNLFGEWHPPIPALLEAADPASILRNDIYDRPPLRWWGRGRVTLLGDAAHPMTPYLGQGGCQAIEDALALARALASGKIVEDALRAYEAERIPRTTMFVKRSNAVGRMAQAANPVLVALRNAVLRRVPPRLQTAGVIGMVESAETRALIARP